ncbi:Meiotically up-regulated gene 89 protein [Cytospora mali]|uniref:Meiotically up-regulated gene 89 protein n=1 Tax=Cytospora mali TaxID=578113 RepID=A0A194W8C2_CYTMA|nr:Meiotically up-regulated gene 89 protein [Valsa mali]
MADSPTRVGHTDSIASQESGSKSNDKKKSRRPANTAFRQQRLKAWQPILTPKTVLPLFFSIGIIFAPIGGLLLYASSQVQEISIDYTTCYQDAPNSTANTFNAVPSANVFSQFKNNTDVEAQWRRETVNVTFDGSTIQTQKCMIQFSIPEDMGPPVLFFYRLTNFYQNHRRYVDSFFDDQLAGKFVTAAQVNSSDCTPLKTQSGTKKPYYPCGLIANSMFNDTFFSPYAVGTENTPYNMSEKGIAWDSDKELYKNISSAIALDSIAVPPNWQLQFPNGYTQSNPPPNIGQNEHFMVWMRTAGLPDFSKLYMRNDTTTMAKGTYQVDILHWFPADVYKGTKSIVLSTRTVMGGRNPFLGIAYIVVGGICILLGAVFAVTHLLKPRKLGDHTYLSWNNVPSSKHPAGSSAAMASGRDLGPTGGV